MARKKKLVESEITEPKKEEVKIEKKFGTIGIHKLPIHNIVKKTLNGIEYNDVHLLNGQTMLLSDSDLEKQRSL